MTTKRDPDVTIATWLDDGPNALPPITRQVVVSSIHLTPQRRRPLIRLPWRTPLMNVNTWRIAAAAVIGFVVIVGGLAWLGGSQGGVGSAPSATPTAAPTSTPGPTAAPTPVPSPASLTPGQLCAGSSPCLNGDLLPGTYWYDGPGVMPEGRLTFTVPAGWLNTDDSVVAKHEGPVAEEVLLSIWIVTHVYADTCRWDGTLVEAGTTIAEIADHIASQKNRVASAVEDVTLGGMRAKRIELTVPADLDVTTCDDGDVRFWPTAGPDESIAFCCVAPGGKDTVYVVDLEGEPFVVDVTEGPEASAVDRAELQAIVDSIVITPPALSPSPPGASPSP